MERFPYNGTWITCGSYAFLNAADLERYLLIDVENSSGATFGMCCMGTEWDYTRLLTPIRDFHCGIDKAAPIWGIAIRHEEYDVFDNFIYQHQNDGASGYVIGPINMANLRYLPLSQQYHCADHYIALKLDTQGQARLIDSEGIVGMNIDDRQLRMMISGKGIPESKGKIHARSVFSQFPSYSAEERIAYTIRKGAENLNYAKAIGQGPKAFLHCAEVISSAQSNLWRAAFEYDLDYVIQRRLMMQKLIRDAQIICRCSVNDELQMLLHRQMETTAVCKYALSHNMEVISPLSELAELEDELTQRWEEWSTYDWN